MEHFKIPECFYRVSVKALVLDREGKFLLVQEENGKWELPGGGLDFGESPQEGLKREIWEEMGLRVTLIEEQPSYFFTCTNPHGQYIVNVLYKTELEHMDFTPSTECMALRFFDAKEALDLKDFYLNVRVFAQLFGGRNSE
ncbi:NUDIX hydrolase [Pleomorphovibrio marinus]|uniref:NUDIX hydrolase n=1 Tax=Pleomorphovibrio marinus TaxID=2164132 RepID=UPI000E0BD069|nr:NUDIX hydrolase [Pleomorphovibrio marinus]